jgi:hypothetical protein
VLQQELDMIEAAAPGGGRIRLLQGDGIGLRAVQQAGQLQEIPAHGCLAQQHLVDAVLTTVGDVQRDDPQHFGFQDTTPTPGGITSFRQTRIDAMHRAAPQERADDRQQAAEPHLHQ